MLLTANLFFRYSSSQCTNSTPRARRRRRKVRVIEDHDHKDIRRAQFRRSMGSHAHSPGELRLLFQRLDDFDDVPGAAALRHPPATSLAARRGGDLPLCCVRRCLATLRKEYRDAPDECRAGMNAHAGGTLSAGAHAGAWTILLRIHRCRCDTPSIGHPSFPLKLKPSRILTC